jgi:nucleotide-binding universal stress UspA family protein
MTQPSGEGGGRIVVGVDGSASSKAALAWAVKQARLSGAVVEAVMAWEFPAAYGYMMPVPGEVDFADIAAGVVADAIAEVSASDEHVKIRSRVAEGNAAQVLLEASEGAELLVVGSRGHGGFTGALLGSVSQHCVQHATCPVVIIREPVAGS